MKIHQILPTISPGDAIGNDVIEIRNILRKWGYKSDIYAQNIHPEMSKIAKKYIAYKKVSSKDNILIFHFSIGSEVSDFVKTLPDKKIMIYHNITPHKYFIGINDYLAILLKNGRNELKSFAGITDLALGDSEYNRLELEELGFGNTDVLPILVDFEKYDNPNYKLLERYEDDCVNILFVGQISPHKRQGDIIKAYYYYKHINPRSRLFLVGNYERSERYYEQLQELTRRLKLKDVYITGMVGFKDMVAYYKLADIFLSMSEHEGFCVPLLESMFFDIPVIAYNSTAIPYTLGDSGILIKEKNYEEIAEMINLLVEDTELRIRIIKKQNERLKEFDKEKVKNKFWGIIKGVMQ
ncbi:glycosyltransferase family 4 protein [candidate division WOR-3 bacterium]|nr:glycosyltransferase family 4 protein [candidate division WOR-3 bacterium]